jgi:hypothetical protein
LLLLALVAMLGTSLAACGNPDKEALDQLRAAMARTKRQPQRFEYRELNVLTDQETVVKGVVADDFRYKARLEVNGQPVMDEVVSDDAVADRFFVPEGIALLARKEPVAAAEPTTPQASSMDVFRALQAKRWVLDPAGAPSKYASTEERRHLGDDPIYDAQTVFDYVDAVSRKMPVRKFNEDALDYKPKEDPFPKPTKASKVVRYDFLRSPVPRPADAASGGGNQAVPDSPNFRKMSVYVKDGIVIRVLEQMDVASRLKDIERNYDIKLQGDTKARIKTAIEAIDAVRKAQGQNEPIRVRTMELRLADVGAKQDVTLPKEPVVGSLIGLINRGKPATGKTATTAPPADADTTTTTAEVTPTSAP